MLHILGFVSNSNGDAVTDYPLQKALQKIFFYY